MKKSLYPLFLFVSLLMAPASPRLFAQATTEPAASLDRPVTVRLQNTPLSEALRTIMMLSGREFVFEDALVAGISVSCDFRELQLGAALDRLLRTTPLTWKRMPDGQIVILKRPPAATATIRGFVRDGRTGEALPYANISRTGSYYGTATNPDGYFVLPNVPVGACTLQVQYIGYRSELLPVTVDPAGGELQVRMTPQAYPGKEVTIYGGSAELIETGEAPSLLVMAPAALSRLPAIGEADIFHTMRLLPGLQTGTAVSGVAIRGGRADESLVLFDGMTMYHVDHFFGFLSTFNPEAVKDIRIYKSGFPARYGGRTAGVVELTGKTGSYETYTAGAKINFLSGSALMQLPLAGRGALLLSLRRSYSDIIESPLYQDIYSSIIGRNVNRSNGAPHTLPPAQNVLLPDFYYYDYMSKLSLNPSKKDLISLSLLLSSDHLDQSQTLHTRINQMVPHMGQMPQNVAALQDVTQWGNRGAGFDWSRQWRSNLYSHSSLAYSRYRSVNRTDLAGAGADSLDLAATFRADEFNQIEETALRMDNAWQVSAAHQLEFGLEALKTRVGVAFTTNDSVQTLRRANQAGRVALYVQDSWQIARRLTLTPGLRITRYSLTNRSYVEPRAAASLVLSPTLHARAAWGHYYQFINRITNRNVLQGNRDFWLLAQGELEPEFARHAVLGLALETPSFLLSVEGYRKPLAHIAEFDQRFQRPPGEAGPVLFRQGNGLARGIEFLLQKKIGGLQGWVGYSLSRVTYTIAGLNGGLRFPAAQDRPHELKLAASQRLGKWHFSTTWIFTSGTPYPASPANPASHGLATPEINNARLPSYHRLDISISRQYSSPRLTFDVGVSVYNLYNHQNIVERNLVSTMGLQQIRDVVDVGFAPSLELGVTFR